MDKNVLEDYIDACKFIKETEEEIKRLEKKRKIVQDKVKGSNPDFPYEARSFNLGGTTEVVMDAAALDLERQLLIEQQASAQELKLKVEEWLCEVPYRIQRIIRYKFFKELTWEETAALMGGKCTADSIRMEFNKFMKK